MYQFKPSVQVSHRRTYSLTVIPRRWDATPSFRRKRQPNIGDLGGLAVAYEAYRLSLNDRQAPMLDGLSGDLRFFLSWAQAWRTLIRDESLRKRVMSDPHGPALFRVNCVVRNLDAWYAAFDVQPGDKLYLAPDERVRIW